MEGNVHILVRVQPTFTNAVQPWIADRFNRKKKVLRKNTLVELVKTRTV